MRIRRISITEDDRNTCGLRPNTLNRLGNVVVLTGPNGGGKSRLLKTIHEKVRSSSSDIDIDIGHGDQREESIIYLDAEVFASGGSIKNNVQDFIGQISAIMQRCEADNKREKEKVEVEKAFFELEKVANLIKIFTGKDFHYIRQMSTDKSRRRKTMHFGDIEFDFDKLSEGEKILLNYCSILYNSAYLENIEIRNSIILIDEPELHLHPEVQMLLYERLKDLTREHGQLIIATHSMSIIASCSFDQLFFAQDGKISAPSKSTIPTILTSLMGYKYQIDQHIALFHEGQELARVSFAAQCLRAPTVVGFKRNDPQVKLIIEATSGASVALLLDYGCGRGRLREELEGFTNVKYYGFDPFLDEDVRTNAPDVFFNKNTFKGNRSKFDFVVLCNVLHEIPITEWMTTFYEIQDAMKEDGFLLLLEDKKLPIGEKPTNNGFIVLTEAHVDFLFSQKLAKAHPKEGPYKSRLYCCLIPRRHLSSLTNERILETLKRLQRDTLTEFRGYYLNGRKTDSLENARRLAFLSFQNVNSRLAIEDLLVANKDLPKIQDDNL